MVETESQDAAVDGEVDPVIDPVVDGGIEARHEGDGTRVVLWGAVDATLRDQASAVMAQALSVDGPVTVDASRVEFLDSSGLAFLLQLVRAGREDGRAVVLENPPALVIELLDLLGLEQLPMQFRED